MTDNRDAWMLRRLLDQPGVLDALLASADGLVRAYSPGLGRDDADSLAAAIAGAQAAGRATAAFCRAEQESWQQSLVQFDGGFVLTVRAAEGTYLSVATSAEADVEQVAFRMHEMVGRLGRELAGPPRHAPDAGSTR